MDAKIFSPRLGVFQLQDFFESYGRKAPRPSDLVSVVYCTPEVPDAHGGSRAWSWWFSCFQQMGFLGKTLGFDAKPVGWSGISNSKTANTLGFPNRFVWLSHNTCRLNPWGSGGRSPLETWIATEKIAIAFLGRGKINIFRCFFNF